MMWLPLALLNISFPELIIIGFVGLIVYGRQLPEVARKIGKTITQLKRNLQEASEQVRRGIEEVEHQPSPEVENKADEHKPSSDTGAIETVNSTSLDPAASAEPGVPQPLSLPASTEAGTAGTGNAPVLTERPT